MQNPSSGQKGAPSGQPRYGQPQSYGQPVTGEQFHPGSGAPFGHGRVAPYDPSIQTSQPGQPCQTGQLVFMTRPAPIPGVPPGLEYMSQINQLLIHQQIEIFEMITGWETQNKYQIKNTLGQQVYFAAEESDVCMRMFCGPGRGFTMHITDNMGVEIIRVTREFKCCAGCYCCAGIECCSMEIKVEAPIGQVCGYTKQTRSWIAPKYDVLDANEQTVLKIEGPICICKGPCCTCEQEFKIFATDGSSQVGKINKQYSGFIQEFLTDADNFCATFPADLDVRIKAVLLGTVFLIDFMFFEQKKR